LSYAHNDLKKAAAIAAERRKTLLAKAIKQKAAANKKVATAVKKEVGEKQPQQPPIQVKQETPTQNGTSMKVEVKEEQEEEPLTAKQQNGESNPHSNNIMAPLDLQKRTVSPAYSDISDEEPPSVVQVAPIKPHLAVVQPLIPSLNNLHRPQLQQHQQKHHPQQPPPAHSSSHKKHHGLSLEESLKRPPQFRPPPPGFPPGFPSLFGGGGGLPAHLAASLAAGRYPPGFMPTPPGFLPVSSSASRLFPPSSSSNALTSASAKLQELQDRVMNRAPPVLSAASVASPPPLRHEHNHTHLHLGYPGTTSSNSVVPPPSTTSVTSMAASSAAAALTYSTLARDLLSPAHSNALSRMSSFYPPGKKRFIATLLIF
jgi:hypothetical protein